MQEPNCLSTEEEFVQFMDNNDLLFHLTVEEAGKLLGYLEGHGFVLGEKEGKLFQGDLCYSNENVLWEEISIDDVVDEICEWNYSLLMDARNNMENPKNFIDFVNNQDRYQELQADEILLDAMYERTKYGKEIEILAEKLAGELVQEMAAKGKIDGAIMQLRDHVKEPEQKQDAGRAR